MPPRLMSRLFAICFAANLLQGTAFGMFLHFPGYLAELGAATTLIGIIAALASLSSLAATPLIGRLLDAAGRRRVILGASGLNVLLCGGFVLLDSLGPGVILLRMLHVAAEMALNVAFFTYALDIVPATRRSQGLAVFGISALGAVGLGAVTGDLAFAVHGYQGVFLASLALSVIAGAAAMALPETRTIPDTPSATRGWVRLLRQSDLWGVWVLTAAFFFAMTSVFVYLKTWVLETGVGSVGLYFAVYSGTAICLRVLFGWVPDRLGPGRVAAPTLLLYALGFALLSVTGSVEMLVAAAVLGGIGHGYGYPVLLTLVANRAGTEDRGSGVAAYGAIDDGAALLAAPALGCLIDSLGYGPMYLAAGALLMIAVAAHLLRERSRWRDQDAS